MTQFVRAVLLVLAIILGVGGGLRGQSEGCPGCDLTVVTYREGFFLGTSPIPGLWITYELLGGSNSGNCVGIFPDCEAASCGFFKVSVTLENTGTVDMDVNYTNGLNRATLSPGQESSFGCSSIPGGELIACGAVRDILQIVKSDEPDSPYVIAMQCTSCPAIN